MMSNKYTPSSNISQSSILAQNQVVQWINEAGMAEGRKRADLLRKITEVLLHQVPAAINTYADNILSYVNDKSTDVKKQAVTFIEEISKLHPKHLFKVIGQLRILLGDSVIAVQKRAIQAASIVYRNSIIWICKNDVEDDDMKFVWQHLTELKLNVLNMIDNENEGIRTHSIKFLEEVVLLQSVSDGPASEGDISLDSLPKSLSFINRRDLEEEAEHIFTLLVKFHNSQHISSVNLMACMTTLCLLARVRSRYAPRVLRALADLHVTLPPTLSQSQVNSVRKHLRMLLLTLVKSCSSDILPQLTQLLADTGLSAQEIARAVPREKRSKRILEARAPDLVPKRIRIDSPQSNSQGSDSNSRGDFIFDEDSASQPAQPPAQTQTNIEDSLLEGLANVENVVELVMATLVSGLPAVMPEDFTEEYKPIPNAGSKAQRWNLARMLATLITAEAVVKPVALPAPVPAPDDVQIPLLREEDDKATLRNAVAKLQESTRAERRVESAVTRLMEETRQEHLKDEERRLREREKEKEKEKERLIPPPTPTVPKLKQKVKLLRLQEITRPIPKEIKERLILDAVSRILRAERESEIGGAAHIRAKFVALFAASYTPALRDLVLDHVLAAPQDRLDLALSWLYEEYAFMQGFNRHPVTLQPKLHEKHDQNYNQLLCSLVTQIYERCGGESAASREALLRRVYLEAPLVTDEAAEFLRHMAMEPHSAPLAIDILEELCATRPPRSHKYAPALLYHVLSEDEHTRSLSISATVRLHSRGALATHARLRKAIEKHAQLFLGFVTLSAPPPELHAARSRQPWSEDLYKISLGLIIALLPENEDLIVEVGRVYGAAGAEAKRCILRAVEAPLRAAVAQTQVTGELPRAARALLDECPRGAETLLTRVVQMLTDRAAPSDELVSRVRELYATRVSDVRFLIPVLTGLSKSEIIAALPKLIKLNPAVVKEVFNKLLGLQGPQDENPPVTPQELLIALHLIDPATADLKYIIKATALCFAEKHTYTQDVLSEVLQRLSEEHEVPVLMMRSVLQALTLYPNVAPLVLNILQLLVDKEAWNHKVAWEGWVKCCERLLPRSTFLLSSLPPRALQTVSPVLVAALHDHVAGLSPRERALLPAHLRHQEVPFTPGPAIPAIPAIPVEPLPPGME